jgi:hypothetical protein
MPLLICVAEKETAASPALTADMASQAPKAEMRRYPIGHFDACSGEWLEKIANDQIAFLHAHLGVRTTVKPEAASQETADRREVIEDHPLACG